MSGAPFNPSSLPSFFQQQIPLTPPRNANNGFPSNGYQFTSNGGYFKQMDNRHHFDPFGPQPSIEYPMDFYSTANLNRYTHVVNASSKPTPTFAGSGVLSDRSNLPTGNVPSLPGGPFDGRPATGTGGGYRPGAARPHDYTCGGGNTAEHTAHCFRAPMSAAAMSIVSQWEGAAGLTSQQPKQHSTGTGRWTPPMLPSHGFLSSPSGSGPAPAQPARFHKRTNSLPESLEQLQALVTQPDSNGLSPSRQTQQQTYPTYPSKALPRISSQQLPGPPASLTDRRPPQSSGPPPSPPLRRSEFLRYIPAEAELGCHSAGAAAVNYNLPPPPPAPLAVSAIGDRINLTDLGDINLSAVLPPPSPPAEPVAAAEQPSPRRPLRPTAGSNQHPLPQRSHSGLPPAHRPLRQPAPAFPSFPPVREHAGAWRRSRSVSASSAFSESGDTHVHLHAMPSPVPVTPPHSFDFQPSTVPMAAAAAVVDATAQREVDRLNAEVSSTQVNLARLQQAAFRALNHLRDVTGRFKVFVRLRPPANGAAPCLVAARRSPPVSSPSVGTFAAMNVGTFAAMKVLTNALTHSGAPSRPAHTANLVGNVVEVLESCAVGAGPTKSAAAAAKLPPPCRFVIAAGGATGRRGRQPRRAQRLGGPAYKTAGRTASAPMAPLPSVPSFRSGPANTAHGKTLRTSSRDSTASSGGSVTKDSGASLASTSFPFAGVFGSSASQSCVFEELEDVITSCVYGTPTTILAYGPSGGGKTYSIFGDLSWSQRKKRSAWSSSKPCVPSGAELPSTVQLQCSEDHWDHLRSNETDGLAIRTLRKIFEICGKFRRAAGGSGETRSGVNSFTVSMQAMEVYHTSTYDLLDHGLPSACSTCATSIGGDGAVIPDCTTVNVVSLQQAASLLHQTSLSRQTGTNSVHSKSSRSHIIVSISFPSPMGPCGAPSTSAGISRLLFVDLAGCERMSSVNDSHLETASINTSLLGLHSVVRALAERAPHIPYRNCLLTRLLWPCLDPSCGAQSVLLVALSAAEEDFGFSKRALEFASSACSVPA